MSHPRNTVTIPERTTAPEREFDYYEASRGVDVYSWSPAPPGTKDARCTQVHLVFQLGDAAKVILRLKSAEACDAVIDALQGHRRDVWGP